MGLAFEMIQVALRVVEWHDLANEVVAHRIIALAAAGEHDPERLCDSVLNEFGVPPPDRARDIAG